MHSLISPKERKEEMGRLLLRGNEPGSSVRGGTGRVLCLESSVKMKKRNSSSFLLVKE